MTKICESLVGAQFDRLTVLEDGGGGNNRKVLCRCECGAEKGVRAKDLHSKVIRSCGCLARELTVARNTSHGLYNTPAYRNWAAMLQRCYNEKTNAYKHYGGKGVVTCEGLKSFETFHHVLGDRPGDKTVDRIDNNRGYECGVCPDCVARGLSCNVRWATKHEQSFNKSTNVRLEWDGKLLNTEEVSAITGVPAATIRSRIFHGWDKHEAATTPVQSWSKRDRTALAETQIWKRISRQFSLCKRIRDDFPEFLAVFGRRPNEHFSFRRADEKDGFWCGDCDECRRLGRVKNGGWVSSAEVKKRMPKKDTTEQPLAI